MDMVPRGLQSAIDVGARDGFLSVSLTDRVEHVVALDLIAPDIAHPRVTAVSRRCDADGVSGFEF